MKRILYFLVFAIIAAYIMEPIRRLYTDEFEYVLKYYALGALGFCIIRFLYAFYTLKLSLAEDCIVDEATLHLRQDKQFTMSSTIIMISALIAVYFDFYTPPPFDFLFVYIIFIILSAIAANSINNMYGVVYTTTNIKDKLDVYSLYLRPFTSDKIGVSKNQEKWICKEADRFFKLYAIGNPGRVVNSIGAESIFATDETWKNDVKNLIIKAKYVILRVGDSDGAKWELESIIDNDSVKKTIFLIDNQIALELFNSKMQSVCPSNLQKPNNESLAVYWDDINHLWVTCEIKSRKDVKQLMMKYIETHSDCCAIYDAFVYKKKHMLRYLFKSDEFPKKNGKLRWGLLMNPFLFLKLNKMRLTAILWIVSIVLTLIAYACRPYYYNGFWIAFTCFLMYAQSLVFQFLFFVFAPRIAWLSRVWPSELMFKHENSIIVESMWNYVKVYYMYLLMPYVLVYVFLWLGWI